MIISVGGGKGGTGKSFIATNIAFGLAVRGKKVLLVDADVESPVDHILLSIERNKVMNVTGFLPKIDGELCIRCGICIDKCPEHALVGKEGQVPILLKDLCEGCYICKIVCPVSAIEDSSRILGAIYRGRKHNLDFIQGEVFPGIKQHISVVYKLIEESKKLFDNYDYIIIDSAPGTGSAVWLTTRIADLILAVTEPTPLGASDLSRFLDLVEGMNKNTAIVINKADISGGRREDIYKIAGKRKVFEVPYSEDAIKFYIEGKSVFSDDKSSISEAIIGILNYISTHNS